MTKQTFLDATLPASDMLHNLARRVMRDPYAAEDLVQETYLQAYRAWHDDHPPDRVEAWLATICLNQARSGFRKRKRRPEEIFDPEAGSGIASTEDTERAAIQGLNAEIVRRALWDLPDEQRIAVTLVDLGGLSTKEAAAAMGTPRGTVLSRVHRGRKALAARVRAEVSIDEA